MKREDETPQVHLVLPSTFESLEELVEQADTFFGAYVSDEDVLYRIVLLASEAATNAIEHGNRQDPSLKVRVSFAVKEMRAVVEVEDEGAGFNPRGVANPLASEKLLDDSGRGVFLINELADHVEWEQDGRRVVIYIDLPPV